MTSLSDYYDMLDRFDWFFDYSDDHSVWQRGNARQSELIRISKESTEHEALWKGFNQHHFSGEPWKTDKQPKPQRPV